MARTRCLIRESSLILFCMVLFVLLLIPTSRSAQTMMEKKEEMSDKYSYLIENGSRLIRENQFEKVLDLVRELPSEKRVDFKIRVIENFAYLKGFLVNKNREYGQKWKVDRRTIVYTGDKTATPILIDLLKDEHAHFRIYTLRALAYLGDQRALAESIKS